MAMRIPDFINLYGDVDGLQPGAQINVGGRVLGRDVKALVEIINQGEGNLVPVRILNINGKAGEAFQLGGKLFRAGQNAILFQSGKVTRFGVAFARETVDNASARICLTSGGVVVLLGLLAVGGLALYLSSRQTPDSSESWLASSVASVKNLLSTDEAQTALAVASYIV